MGRWLWTSVVLLLPLVAVLLPWHRITCMYSVQLCTDLFAQLASAPWEGRPDPWPTEPPNHDPAATCPQPTLNLAHTLLAEAGRKQLPKRHLGAPGDPEILILLSSQRTGSTWLNMMLKQNDRIWIGSERLLGFSRRCRRPLGGWRCSWIDLKREMEEAIRDVALVMADRVVGFRIQYDQLPGNLRNQFALWADCNRITVLHFTRDAVIQSFFSLQARAVDFAASGKYVDDLPHGTRTSVRNHLFSNRGLKLDPQRAAAYVRNVEASKSGFRWLLKRRCKYLELVYEDLIGPDAASWWAAVHHFLDASAGFSVFLEVEKVWSPSIRLHPGTCRSKILNWAQVAAALEGTQTLLACNAEQLAEETSRKRRVEAAPPGMSSVINKALKRNPV